MGEGVEQNYAEALKWFTLAAEQGNVYGQYALGCYYYEGKAVEPDLAEAEKWFTLAAQQGDEDAAKLLEEIRSAK